MGNHLLPYDLASFSVHFYFCDGVVYLYGDKLGLRIVGRSGSLGLGLGSELVLDLVSC